MRPDPSGPPPSVRVRRRAVAIGLAVVVVAGASAWLELGPGAREPARGDTEGAVSGSWFCPHGGGEGWKGWVIIANPGSVPVDVRVTGFSDGGVREVTSMRVLPQRHVYHEVFASHPSASTQVEYFGGWVGASAVLRAGGAVAPTASERCAEGPAHTWFLPDQRTGRDEHTFIVVMNPFAEEASFDVVFTTERRSDIRPKPLSPFVVRARHSVAVRVNDHVLKAPGERTVAASVIPRVGRVVAAGLATSDGTFRAEGGIASPRSRAIVPAAGYAGTGELLLVNPGTDPVDLLVVSEGATAHRPVAGPGGMTLGPEAVRTMEVGVLPDAGIVVRGTDDSAVVAAMRLVGDGGDAATIAGAARPERSWLVLPSLPPGGGRAFVVLENEGPTEARVTIRLLGPNGPVSAAGLQSFQVAPGRTVRVPLPPTVEATPLSAVVVAAEGTVVAAGASYSRGDRGYAATLGLPIRY